MKLKYTLFLSVFLASIAFSASFKDLDNTEKLREIVKDPFSSVPIEEIHTLLDNGADLFAYMDDTKQKTIFSRVEELAAMNVPYAKEILASFWQKEYDRPYPQRFADIVDFQPDLLLQVVAPDLYKKFKLPDFSNTFNRPDDYGPEKKFHAYFRTIPLSNLYVEIEMLRYGLDFDLIGKKDIMDDPEIDRKERLLKMANRELIIRMTKKAPEYVTLYIDRKIWNAARNKIYEDFKIWHTMSTSDLLHFLSLANKEYAKHRYNSLAKFTAKLELENAYRLLYTKVMGVDPGFFTTVIDPTILEKAKEMV